MIQSGVAPIDERLGGVQAGRIHVLAGGPGSGKSTACLLFLAEGLRQGESALLITVDARDDIRSQGRFLGLDLGGAWRDRRLVVARFRPGFVRQIARSGAPRGAADELARLLDAERPARIAVDTIGPFLADSTFAPVAVESLTEFLLSMGATSLVTFPGDLATAYDRRLEPLVRQAAAVLQLSHERGDQRRLELLKSRFSAAGASRSFVIQAGAGFTPAPEDAHDRDDRPRRRPGNRVLLAHLSAKPPDELLQVLRRYFEVTTVPLTSSAAPALDLNGHDVVALVTTHESCDGAAAFVRAYAQYRDAPPLVILAAFNLRSADRARFLRAGADEFLSGELSTSEFLVRLERVIERGRRAPVAEVRGTEAIVLQPSIDGESLQALDAGGFARALAAHVAHDDPLQYAVISLEPQRGSGGTTDLGELADVATRAMRLRGGDLAAVIDGRVVLYLHGSRRRDTTSFVERVRERWARLGGASLSVETLASPSDEPHIRRRFAAVGAS